MVISHDYIITATYDFSRQSGFIKRETEITCLLFKLLITEALCLGSPHDVCLYNLADIVCWSLSRCLGYRIHNRFEHGFRGGAEPHDRAADDQWMKLQTPIN